MNRALGCLATLGPVGRAPRRLDVRTTAIAPIEGGGALPTPAPVSGGPSSCPPAPGVEEPAGFAEPVRGFRPSPHRPARTDKPHLYLVKTDED